MFSSSDLKRKHIIGKKGHYNPRKALYHRVMNVEKVSSRGAIEIYNL